jgi:hypothetical protein
MGFVIDPNLMNSKTPPNNLFQRKQLLELALEEEPYFMTRLMRRFQLCRLVSDNTLESIFFLSLIGSVNLPKPNSSLEIFLGPHASISAFYIDLIRIILSRI